MTIELLLDIDDTIVDLRNPTRELFRKHSVPFCETKPDFCGGDPEIYKTFQRLVREEQGFCRNLPLRAGAENFINELRRHEVNVIPCTAPQLGPYWIPERTEVLGLLGFDEQRIHWCWYKYRVAADAIVEDNHKNGTRWLERNPQGHVYLLEHAWTMPEHALAREVIEAWRDYRLTRFEEWEFALERIIDRLPQQRMYTRFR